MGGARLKRFPIAHHRFDGIGVMRSREFLCLCFQSLNDRQCNIVFRESPVDAKNTQGFLFSILIGRVSGMPFLPQEFRGSQKQPCAHFPSNDIAPLIQEQWQIPIRLDPIPVRIPNNGLRRGPDDERFVEFRAAGVSNHSHLRSESLDVFGFFLKKTFGYE